MSIYHLHIKNALKGHGKGHAAYICREGKYVLRQGEEMLLKESGNMPVWAQENNIDFWHYADLYERANGRSYKEIEISLPNELTHEQQIALTREFIKQEVGKDYPYTVAIHDKPAANDKTQKQPHAHIMMCERKLDGIDREPEQFFSRFNRKNPEKGGAGKDRSWHSREKVFQLRKAWEVLQNEHLKKHGHESQVDCRTLKEMRAEALAQNNLLKAELYDREPMKKAGWKLLAIKDKDIAEDTIAFIKLERYKAEVAYKKIKEEIYRVKKLNQEKEHLEKSQQQEISIYELRNKIDRELNKIDRNEYYFQQRLQDIERRIEKMNRAKSDQAIQNTILNKFSQGEYKKSAAAYRKIQKEHNLLAKIVNEGLKANPQADFSKELAKAKELQQKGSAITAKTNDIYKSVYGNPKNEKKIRHMKRAINNSYEKKLEELQNTKDLLEMNQAELKQDRQELLKFSLVAFKARGSLRLIVNKQPLVKQKGIIQRQIEKAAEVQPRGSFRPKLYDEKGDFER